MSHLEDLEEYDAELELALKHEYATVFGMFRYCVLTQEATYLCNVLNLKPEHQPSYPLFHLTMEDVWVWDKNRPSRIIPRAEVHTSSDITVEELKPPDDRCRRRSRPSSAHRPKPDPGDTMLLAVDVGNTQTVLGLYRGREIDAHWRLTTDPRRTTDELDVELAALLARRGLADVVTASALSTTVPTLTHPWTSVLRRIGGTEPIVIGPGVRTGVPVRTDNPREVGPDRIANSVAAHAHHGGPCIVVDFGTSTNFDVVSADGEFLGGAIAPGVEISMEALYSRAARAREGRPGDAGVGDRQVDGRLDAVGRGVRLRGPGGRARAPHPGRARRSLPGGRDRRPGRSADPALRDHHGPRAVADARRAAAGLGAQPARVVRYHRRPCRPSAPPC